MSKFKEGDVVRLKKDIGPMPVNIERIHGPITRVSSIQKGTVGQVLSLARFGYYVKVSDTELPTQSRPIVMEIYGKDLELIK